MRKNSNPARQCDRTDRGFTLLELLISLGLLAVITSFLFSSVGTVRRAWQGMETAGQQASTQAVRSYLQQRLSQVAYVLKREGGAGDIVAFSGSPDKVSFVAEATGGLTVPGLFEVSIWLDRVAASVPGTIRVKEALHRPRKRSRVDSGASHTRNLLSGVTGLQFRYFGVQSVDDLNPKWWDNWNARRLLPRLVSVQMSVIQENGVEETWPAIIVATRNSNTRLSSE